MNKNLLLELLQDSQLRSLANRYAPGLTGSEQPSLSARLDNYRHQLAAERFVLPVAGIQGSGKSTLLSALAFDEPVLPIDADETTCVPVEIGWAAHPRPQATVHYLDGRTEKLPCTEEALRSVVHNENNPGNEKQVLRVVLESSREVFRHGLVLVDLPGTGSLTEANMVTTQRYLAEAVGVIFMLRTVPPLTRSEATFVSLQWASLRTALFVQNRWNDEDDDEALAGRDHNAKVLQDIAKKAHIQLDGPPSIHVVNGYQSLRAALMQDHDLAEKSGLNALRTDLEHFGSNWAQRVGEGIVTALKAELSQLVQVLDGRLGSNRLERGDLQARITALQHDFDERLSMIDQEAGQMRDEANAFRRQVRQQLRDWSRDKGAELRNRMRTKMRAGIVDGTRLTRALTDEQALATDDIFLQVQEGALTLQDKLRSRLQEADAWNAQAPDLRATVHREESTKWENLARPIGSAAGGVGGALVGAAIAGAQIGSLGGPIGVVVGIVGGLLGGLLGGLTGNWLGNKSKELVTEQRAKAAESEVFAAIDSYLNQTSTALNNLAESFSDQLDVQLEQSRQTEIATFEQQRQQLIGDMTLSNEDKTRAAATLGADRTALQALQIRLDEVTA